MPVSMELASKELLAVKDAAEVLAVLKEYIAVTTTSTAATTIAASTMENLPPSAAKVAPPASAEVVSLKKPPPGTVVITPTNTPDGKIQTRGTKRSSEVKITKQQQQQEEKGKNQDHPDLMVLQPNLLKM